MSRTLLLADGSVTIQRVIELSFAHEDIRVLSVSDGRKAIQMLEAEQPHVVMLDVDLPEMDGYTLAAHIRRMQRMKNVPILLLAGAFEPVDQERARDVGSDGVILKPFEPQIVVSRVKELMDQRDRELAPPVARKAEPAASPAPRQAPPAEATHAAAAESQKPARESAFLRVAPREREAAAAAEAAPVLDSLELPTGPLWESSPPAHSFGLGAAGHQAAPPVASAPPVPPMPTPTPAAPPRVTLANAFTALLAAEQHAQPPGAPAAALSEASIEDAVRRVLVRMTDDLVRRIVLDTAERLIREEIERIKANPD